MALAGFALLLAVVDTSVFISGHAVIKRLVESMAAVDDSVRAPTSGPFKLRIQVVIPFKVRGSQTSGHLTGGVAPFKGPLLSRVVPGQAALTLTKWPCQQVTLEAHYLWSSGRHARGVLFLRSPIVIPVKRHLLGALATSKARIELAAALSGGFEASSPSATLGTWLYMAPHRAEMDKVIKACKRAEGI